MLVVYPLVVTTNVNVLNVVVVKDTGPGCSTTGVVFSGPPVATTCKFSVDSVPTTDPFWYVEEVNKAEMAELIAVAVELYVRPVVERGVVLVALP